MGVRLHFRTNVRFPETTYLFHSNADLKNSFLPKNHFGIDFDKPLKNQRFHYFSHHKKLLQSHQKSHQTLTNQYFYRTQPKITYLIKKQHIKTNQFTTHQSFKSPVKSIFFNHSKFTNNTTLSKS